MLSARLQTHRLLSKNVRSFPCPLPVAADLDLAPDGSIKFMETFWRMVYHLTLSVGDTADDLAYPPGCDGRP